MNREKCTGCGLCVEACDPRCLRIENDIAVLFDPDRCGSEEHCIPACKDNAIKMAWVPMMGGRSIGKWIIS